MIDVRLVSLATILQPPGVFLQIFLQIVQVQGRLPNLAKYVSVYNT